MRRDYRFDSGVTEYTALFPFGGDDGYRSALWHLAIGAEWYLVILDVTPGSVTHSWLVYIRDRLALRPLAAMGDEDAVRMIGGGQ